MKRNDLLAKSLTLGLAVATAAASMSVPGLAGPQTVYADEEGASSQSQTQNTPIAPTVKVEMTQNRKAYVLNVSPAAISNTITNSALEYSFDEQQWKPETEIEKQEFTTSETKTLYTRWKAVTEGGIFYKASASVQSSGVVIPGKSSEPAITGVATSGGIEVTLSPSAGVTTAPAFYYTIDGTEPDTMVSGNAIVASGTTIKYNGAFVVSAGATVKAIALEEDKIFSDLTTKQFSGSSPVNINEASIAEYVELTTTAALIYNGTNLSDKVEVTAKAGKELSNLAVSYTKNGQQKNDIKETGTYQVLVSFTAGNEIASNVTLGAVTVAKYTPMKEDFTVTANSATYNGNGVEATVACKKAFLNQNDVKLSYYKDSSPVSGKPTDAGTYDVYVAYTGNDNINALAATASGIQLTINKGADLKPQLTALVTKCTTGSAVTYGALKNDFSNNSWTVTGDVVTVSSITVTGNGNNYIEDVSCDATGEISFKIKENAVLEAGQNAVEFTIQVELTGFTNYEKITATIPVTITNKDVAKISLTNANNLTFDGTDWKNKLTYTITTGSAATVAATEGAITNLNVTVKKNSSGAEKMTDAGTYSITAVYDDGTYYGKLTQDVLIAKKDISSDIAAYFTLTDPTLTYNLSNQTDNITKKVKVSSSAIKAGEYTVNVTGTPVDVGLYPVTVDVNATNYTASAGTLGNAIITKAALTLTATANGKGAVTIKLGEYVIQNDDSHLSFKKNSDNSTLTAIPTAVGTHDITITYTDNKNLVESEQSTVLKYTVPTSSSSVSGAGGGGGSASTDTSNKTDTSKTETKPDGSTVKTETTTNNDGSTTTKTETTNKDGSTETKTETTNKDGSTETKTEVKNTDGSTESKTEVKKADGSTESKTEVKKTDGSTKTTTEVKNADGSSEKKTETIKADGSSTSKTVIKEEGTKVVVNTSKDADGTTTTAKANVQIVSEDNSAGISAEMVDKLTAEAGTKDVTISQRIFNTEGKTICKVNAKASDLKAGKKLKVFKIDSETGELTLINNATYKVDKKGNVSFDGLQKANYQVMTATEANKYAKQVLKTVKAAESKKTVTEGKQTKMKLDSGLNMKNVKKITYKTNRKSVATVDKNGKVTTKKSGKVNVTATVTLKNGKKKNVTMTLSVKAER